MNLMFRISLFFILFLSLAAPAFCEEELNIGREEFRKALEYLQGEAVSVNINARITGQDGKSVWNAESQRLTISGRSVTVTMEGETIKVVANIIPFINDDNTILLVAKGEVWLSTGESRETEYYTTMKSLPVEAGESIMFFPVGVAVDMEKNVYTIEMEIKVNFYEE